MTTTTPRNQRLARLLDHTTNRLMNEAEELCTTDLRAADELATRAWDTDAEATRLLGQTPRRTR